MRLVLEGGAVVDGTGVTPPRRADVLVRGGVVEAIVPRSAQPFDDDHHIEAERRLDCAGALVAPGFIDIHTHSDLTWLSTPDCTSRVTQGVTSEVIGNCGMSPAPRDDRDPGFRRSVSVIDQDPDMPLGFTTFEQYLERLGAHQAAVDVLPLVGHGSVRQTALFSGDDAPTAVASVVRQALIAGAWGTSLGLMYPPGESAGPDELAAVAEVTAAEGALLAVHLRAYEGGRVEQSLDEMVQIHARTGVNLEISHLRAVRAAEPSVIDRCLLQLENAGPLVNADTYPYTAGQTTLFQLLTPEDRQVGQSEFLAKAVHCRDHYVRSIAACGFDPMDILVVRAKNAEDSEMIGSTLASISDAARQPWPDVAIDLLWRNECYVDVVVFGSRRSEQEQILGHPKVMIGSDGFSIARTYAAAVHPRAFGAFPKALRLLVDGGMSWERSISKATGMPATKLGLKDRGILEPGRRADIAVIDPGDLADRATYDKPLTPSSGVRHVLVAGVPVLESGRQTGAYPGRVALRG